MLTTAVVRDGRAADAPTDPRELAALLADPTARVWVDIESPNDAEYAMLSAGFQFHPLAIEDCRIQNELPKLDNYGDVLFLVLHSPLQDKSSGALQTQELHFFVGATFLVTVHDDHSSVIDDLRREVRRETSVLTRGSDFLLHAVLDRVADQYLTLLDTLDGVTYDIEQRVMGSPDASLLETVFAIKRQLLHLVRLSHLQREVVHRLSREPFPQINETARWYFRDVYDHFFQVSSMAEFYRDTVTGVRDAYLSVVSNRLNETMKVLTAFATVVLPLTVVTGIYGMNFDHMPELHWRFGYPAVLVVMAVMGVGLAAYFRRRGWW
jgi:magnesium transporter